MINEFTIFGTLESVGPLEETSSGIKVVNFVVTAERPFRSSQPSDEFRITAFKELAEDVTSSAIAGAIIIVR